MDVHSDAVLRNHNNNIVDAGDEPSKRFSVCHAVIQFYEMGRLVVSNRCSQQQWCSAGHWFGRRSFNNSEDGESRRDVSCVGRVVRGTRRIVWCCVPANRLCGRQGLCVAVVVIKLYPEGTVMILWWVGFFGHFNASGDVGDRVSSRLKSCRDACFKAGECIGTLMHEEFK